MTVKNTSFRSKKRNQLLSALAVTLVATSVGASTGCSSTAGARVASLNPFAKSNTPTANSTPSSFVSGPNKVAATLASGAKSATSKTGQAFAGLFGKDDSTARGNGVVASDELDPVSLAHKGEVSPEVFVANGRLWESTGNFEKAMESYAKALETRPNDPAALSNIARLHFRQNNHVKAAEYFGQAIKQKPDDAGLFNDLGLTLSKLGNHGAAAKTIEQALQLNPTSSRYANNLASVYFESGDSASALEVLVKHNKPAVAHFNMAYLHYKHGQASEATRHLNQSLAYGPQGESDPATKRAVERSGELLAQLQSRPGSPTSTPGTVTPNTVTPNTVIAKTDSASGSSPSATNPAAAAPSVSGYQMPVAPASTGTTSVTYGNATYRQPTQQNEVNQTSASLNVPGTRSDEGVPTSTPPSSSGQPTGGMALPPGF